MPVLEEGSGHQELAPLKLEGGLEDELEELSSEELEGAQEELSSEVLLLHVPVEWLLAPFPTSELPETSMPSESSESEQELAQ